MERYEIINEVGGGTYGNVWRALDRQTRKVVAIKKLKRKYVSWEECLNLREVKSLRKMNHPNIVKLKNVIMENNVLYFVFEYMECNLYQLVNARTKPFSEDEVRHWCFQIFQGLAHMHQNGFFHRDLKPENLLASGKILKIADLGFAREIDSRPPYTEYVSTRWYRSPEVLLQAPIYGPAVDMWAMGAIMAELFTLNPLFPGKSSGDQMYKICCVLGTPTEFAWHVGLELANAINYKFPEAAGITFSKLMPGVSDDAINLIETLCSWDPYKRPTAEEALQHPFFKAEYNINSNNTKQQPQYLPSGMSVPLVFARRTQHHQVSDVAEQLEKMTMGAADEGRTLYIPPPMVEYQGWRQTTTSWNIIV